jgi:hypothetical protein
MKYLLFSLLLLASWSAFSAECFVVSGAGKDGNGAFKNRKILKAETSMVNGRKCTVVKGLAALKTAVEAAKVKGTLKWNADLLVVFGAHGTTENGVIKYDFDADVPKVSDVYTYLRTLSQSYHVGAVVHACQSGELMNKLIQEENDPLASKLCLFTSSSRGRDSFSNENDLLNLLEKVGKPDGAKNLEQVYLKTTSGTISSAAWEETGVAKYYRTKNEKEALVIGMEAIKDIDQFVRAPGACNTDAEINSALCVAPGVSDTIYKDLMHFSDPFVPVKALKDMHVLATISADLMEGNAKICHKGLGEFYKARQESIKTWGDLEAALVLLKKDTKLIAACEAYKKLMNDPTLNQTLYAGEMQEGLTNYQTSLVRLKKVYSKTDWNHFDLKSFAQNASGDKKMCSPESKKETIQDVFGDKFFKEDSYSVTNGNPDAPGENAFMRDIHVQHMMKAFQNASVDKAEMPNAVDAARRKACRDFKL